MRSIWMLSLAVLIGVVSLPRAWAAVGNAWFSAQPSIEKIESGQIDQLPESLGFAGNIPCQTTRFIVRPRIPPTQLEKVESACAVMTTYGPVASGGLAHVLGITARLYTNTGAPLQLYSIPKGKGAVRLETTSSGTMLHFYPFGVMSSRREWNAQTGEWKFYLADQGLWTVRDSTGSPLYVRPESIAFSRNGRWMIVDAEHRGKLRIDLETRAVVRFDNPYTYHLGLSVTPHMAISDDGMTAIATSDRGDVTLVNIASCDEGPCQQTTIEGQLRQQIAGFHRVYQPRFISDNLISMYVSYSNASGKRSLTQIRLSPSGSTSGARSTYLALGDSFTSGEGAYDYFPGTDTIHNKCHLSRQSYPYLAGQYVGSATRSVACSGARIDDISNRSQKPRPPNESNSDALPGIKPQLQYVIEQWPQIVSISIGGNDIGFGDKQKQCLAPGTCFAAREDRQELLMEMHRQLPRLTALFSQVRQSASAETKVYAIGYPQVADETARCGLDVPLDSEERKLIRLIITHFNSVIMAAAARAGVGYVNVEDAFTGRRLCEAAFGLAMNGIVLGDDVPFSFGPIGNESFHPNNLGHRLLTTTILSRSLSLHKAMPSAADSTANPDKESEDSLLQAPTKNRAIRQLYYRPELAPDLVTHGDSLYIQIEGDAYFLQPSSQMKVELHSTPVRLGELAVDTSGSVDGKLKIPEDISAGWHTVHIYGQDVFGRTVDIYKSIYISDGTPICYAYGNRNCLMKNDSTPQSPGAPPVTDEPAPMNTPPPNTATVEVEKNDKPDDVLAAETSQRMHQESDTPVKQSKKVGRVRQFFRNWWDNKTARWTTIVFVIVAIVAVAVYPRTRYLLLNTAGVRSSASVVVIDSETRQPLKNVTVQLNNANATTNDDGYVKLEDVRLGETSLVVTRKAFAPLEKQVTVGWGSNPFGEVLLEPKGLQYSFIIKDFLSGKPIEKAEAVSGEASAFSDKDGKLVLTLDTTSEEPVEITVTADGYRTDKIIETAESTNDKEINMVPAQEQAFISKRSGKYDLYKIYADGTGEALVLSGTGYERDDITLVPQPTGTNVALVSTRDNQRGTDGNLLSTLNIVNINDNKVTKLDTGDSIQVIGWVEDTVVYIVVSEQPANNAKKQRLVSYNMSNGQKLDIATANYFNAAMVAGDKVYYAPAADIQAAATGTNVTQVGLFVSDTSGANTKRLLEQEVWSMVRTGYDTINFSTGKDWYEYKLGGNQPSRIGGAPADQKSRIYTNNAGNTQSLWIDQRDGKGVLISYDLGSKQDKVLTGQSGLVYPVRWLNDTTAVYRIHSSDETADYVVSTNGGEPKKIVNVTNTAGVDKWYYY